jgi:hypothetical protein
VRILQQPRTAIAGVEVTRNGKQPRAKAGVAIESPRVDDQPEPGLLEKILGNLPTIREPCKEVVEAAVEGGVDHIERLRVADPETFDELELDVAVHQGTNADIAET